MILVFGGTTEGRKAVKTLEEAGSPYYYSTRSADQAVELVHGRRLTGAMDVDATMAFCDEHDIRLIVDAAHPFAEELHLNLLIVSHRTGLPLIRFDRIYPPHTDDITWCKDYDDAMAQLHAQGVKRLLALTGVQTIARLRPYWEKNECWWRILDRHLSQTLADKNGFPEDHLVYYEHDDTASLIERLQPQAILTKESGMSGGFCEKAEAARKAGVKVFVVERPAYPPQTATTLNVHTEQVNGEHGLRRTVEKLLPDFFPLKSGLTTGTCATAAAIADVARRLLGRQPAEVPVVLPNGETISVPVGYGDDYAYVIKDSGDDPDVTKGIEIRVKAQPQPKGGEAVTFEAGEGVGHFTLPGFDFPPGEPAINRVPRQMIEQNLRHLLSHLQSIPSPSNGNQSPLPWGGAGGGPLCVHITISVPGGEEIARRTFNPRLGIEGGISIVGVSGIIKPFSEEAFVDSIRKCMQVAKASGTDRVVINSGGKSERYVSRLYPNLPRQAFVEYGNYIGETLRMADELGFASVTLGVMLGKAVKLAEGQLDTHSRRATMNKDFIAQILSEADIHVDLTSMTLARELWTIVPPDRLPAMVSTVISHCRRHCAPLFPRGELTILLISDDGQVYDCNSLLVTDGLNGIHVGGLLSGDVPEEHTDTHAD